MSVGVKTRCVSKEVFLMLRQIIYSLTILFFPDSSKLAHQHLFHSSSSNCPLLFSLSLPFPPPSFPLLRRCRDPRARWCITKDTCSVDVARQIDFVLVSVCLRACLCVCVCVRIYSFINFLLQVWETQTYQKLF